MPLVRKGESRKEYLKRAIPFLVEKEKLTPKVAIGKAEGMFTYYKGKDKHK